MSADLKYMCVSNVYDVVRNNIKIVPLFDYFIFLPLLIVPNVTFSNDASVQINSERFSMVLRRFN